MTFLALMTKLFVSLPVSLPVSERKVEMVCSTRGLVT
jgi:hypothetical protein